VVFLKPLDINWLRNARMFAFEAWWPPFWPEIDFDWERAHWTMQRLSLDTLQANALTKWALYPTELVRQHPGLGGRDLVAEARDFCDRHGYRMIIYTLFGHSMPITTELSLKQPAIARPMLPDLNIRQNRHHMRTVEPAFADYHTRFHFGDERYVAHCPFAAREWLRAMFEELADRYVYEAAWIDGSLQCGWINDSLNNVCTCPTCQTDYLHEFGRPMPIISDPADPRMQDLVRWSMRRLDALLAELAPILTRGGQLPLIGNIANLEPVSFHPPIVRNLNGGLFEHARDTVDLARKAAQARHLVETAIIYPDCYDPWPRKVTAGWEVENKGLMLLAYGATPYLAQPGKYYYDDHMDEPARRIFSFMKDQKPLLEAQQSDAFCAVASLPGTVDRMVYDFHTNGVRGWVGAMIDSHTTVTDVPYYLLEDAETVQRYPVIVLEDVEWLSDRAVETLTAYVENGGGLYIGMNTGVRDERGKPREGDTLARLFGLLPWSPTPEQQSRRDRFEGSYEHNTGHSKTYDVYARSREGAMAEAGFAYDSDQIHPAYLGHLIPDARWTVLADVAPSDAEAPLMPLLAVRTLGRGRMVYCAASFGTQYEERNDPAMAQFLRDTAIWLGGKPMIRCDGSREVFLGTARTGDGWLLYLVNNSADRQGKRQDWWEMMKWNEPPLEVGSLTLALRGTHARAIYGPAPDRITRDGETLRIAYDAFCDNVVLHVV